MNKIQGLGQRRHSPREPRLIAEPRSLRKRCGSSRPWPVRRSAARRIRIVYVDYDPIVLAHARALMASHDGGLIDYLDADLRDTQPILDQASRILDFSQPVAIMHAIGDRDNPYEIVARLIGAVPPGSYLVLSHGAADIDAEQMAEVAGVLTGPAISSSPRAATLR